MIREKLLRAGVANLKEFGYPNVNTVNILTDPIYSAFFLSMLRDNKGKVPQADPIISELIGEIESLAEVDEPKPKKRAATKVRRNNQASTSARR